MPGPIHEIRALVETALEASLPVSALSGAAALNEAIRSAVFPGGKRFRPVFTLLTAEAAGVPIAKALDAACAVELLHCSSLVFDDLPCMDDAGLRRNRPTLHRLFGESTALLAGLALFNEAFRLFGRYPRLMSEVVDCVGVDGMIGGQWVDVSGVVPDIDSRDCKTSGLMRLTFIAGPCCGPSDGGVIELLAQCGDRLGRAYQMLDDLLDGCGATGKTALQDARHNRLSHSTCEGSAVQRSRDRALAEVESCCEEMEAAFGSAATPLVEAIHGIFATVSRTGLVAA